MFRQAKIVPLVPVRVLRCFAGCNLSMTICHDSRDYNSSCKNVSCQPWLILDFTFFRREDTAVTWPCQGISKQQGQSQPPAVVSFSPPKWHKKARAGSHSLDKLFRQLYWRSWRGIGKVSRPNSLFLPCQSGLHCMWKTLRGFYTNLPILKVKLPTKQQFYQLLLQFLNAQTNVFIRE